MICVVLGGPLLMNAHIQAGVRRYGVGVGWASCVLPVCVRARVSAFDECIQLNRFLMSSSIIAVLFFCKQETTVKL